jgi:amyloid beta A4 protein
VEHLADIDRLVNESLQMLSRYEDLNTKILPLMEDYLIALRSRDNTPASLLRMDKSHEEEMINNYTSDIKDKIQGAVYRPTIQRCPSFGRDINHLLKVSVFCCRT